MVGLPLLIGVVLTVVLGAALAAYRSDLPVDELVARYTGPPSRFAEVQGMRIHYRDQGAGPALVLLHGSPNSLHTWEGWVAELRNEFRLISLDCPGNGLTGPHPRAEYDAVALARVVEALAVELRLETFALAGNSKGGEVAWHYTLAYPERVEKLILVAAIGLPVDEPLPAVFRMLRWPLVGRLLAKLTPRAFVEGSLRSAYGDRSKVSRELVTRHYELIRRRGNRGAMRPLALLPRVSPLWAHIGTIKAPTLILWGAEDRWILPKYAHAFGEALPGSTVRIYEGLGHVPHEEDPVRTAGDVRRFLKSG